MFVEFVRIALDWFTTKVYLMKTKPLRKILSIYLDPLNEAHENIKMRYGGLLDELKGREEEVLRREVMEFPMMHGFGQGLLSILSSVVVSSLTYYITRGLGFKVDLIQTSDDGLIQIEKPGMNAEMAK